MHAQINKILPMWIDLNIDKKMYFLYEWHLHVEYAYGIWCLFNPLRLTQNGHRFPYDIFKHIFLNENARITLQISLKFDP